MAKRTEAAARARLVEALKSLRAFLARGPQREVLPCVYRDQEGHTLIEAVRAALPEADEMTRQEIDHFLAYKVNLRLTSLPAPRSILRRLDEFMEDPEGPQVRAEHLNGPWSKADTPTRWAKLFGVSAQTFKRWVKAGKIRVKELSDRSYQVHLEDLPQPKPAQASNHK
jgi:hypothetical protein